MAKQPELVLEEQLVTILNNMGYGLVQIKDEKDLLINLKQHLEKHNNIQFTDKEFERVLNILSKGTVFEKAKTLREKQHIVSDAGDNLYFEFINSEFLVRKIYLKINYLYIKIKFLIFSIIIEVFNKII